LYAFFCGFICFCGHTCRNNGLYITALLGAKIRAAITEVLFVKLSALSQFMIKTSELGKITNMISNDFNLI